jgi:hypothetical protein
MSREQVMRIVDAMRVVGGHRREERQTQREHITDADCTIGDDDCCVECGVLHGDPCPECGGKGYHVDGCQAEDRRADDWHQEYEPDSDPRKVGKEVT